MWDVRAVLGSDYVDKLALRAIKHVPLNYNDYLGAILEEDDDKTFSSYASADNDPDNGTPNIVTICQAFSDAHGIYDPYCEGYVQQPVAIISDPSPIFPTPYFGQQRVRQFDLTFAAK